MFGLSLRALAIFFVGIFLTACGTHPKPVPEVQEIYEITDVAVTANAAASSFGWKNRSRPPFALPRCRARS